MVNPRNAYQRYNAATNTTDRTLFTYMGMLLPGCGNLTYSGAGALAPLPNDPNLRTIGSGVPVFLGGAKGMVIGEGTQHSPATGFATLMVSGDLKQMQPQFLRAATMYGYGATLYLGVGAAIPILDVDMVRSTAITDDQITVNVIDYGIPQRDRPALRSVTYAELKSGKVELNGEEVRTSPLSSYNRALQVATTLKTWIEKGDFAIALPVRYMDRTTAARPLRETKRTPRVKEIMDRQVVSVTEDEEIRTAAEKLLKGETNHIPVLDRTGRLVGIVTTYDVSKAVLRPDKGGRVRDIMTRRVIRTSPDEPVDIAARKLEKNNISALPVVDSADHVIGMLTAIDLGKLFGGRWQA
jgi:CBS domain-containing protein